MRKILCCTAALAMLALAAAAWGQGTTSKVTGVIMDPSGAVVPGAAVTLTNEATGVSFKTVSSEAGTYVFEAVQVGVYTLTVELVGFKKSVLTGNRVTIGQPTTVNVTLQLGEASETVTVTDTYELVQTSTSGNIGNIIEQKVLQDLPIVGTRGRNPLSLVNTQPGVVVGSNTGGGVHVHGSRDRAWNFTLDGIDTNETSAGGSNFSPLRANPDSLAEFRVITSNPTAEYGRSSGAQVTMVTRSGGDEYHGSVFWFYRTPRFNANEWENNLNGVGKRQFVQHIPGFSIGGPIFKGRTFFFTNMQWLRARDSGLVTRTVYTDSARKGIFRYVKGGRNLPAGVTGASVDSSGNVLPGVNIGTYDIAANDPERIGFDPNIKKVIGLTPLPNNFTVGDGLNTAGFSFSDIQNERQYDAVVKVDHVIGNRSTVFGRIAWGHQNTMCDTVNAGQRPFPGLTCRVNTYRLPRNVAVNWRWNPSPRITNEFVAGFNRFTFDFVLPLNNAGVPYYALNDITVPEDTRYGNKRRLTTYQFVDNFTYVRGAHAFKMGTNLRFQQHYDQRGSVAGQNIAPVVNFSTTYATVSPTEFNLPADINVTYDRPLLQRTINNLLGRVGQITQGFVAQGDRYAPGGTWYIYDARFPELDFYWQDTWKMRRNLTVDLGLRLEMKLSPRNPDDRIFGPDVPVKIGAAPSITVRWRKGKLYDDDLNNWAPSIGVAWDPLGTGKTSVRANYRLAYDRISTFGLSSAIFQSIPGQTLGVVDTAFGSAGGRLRNVPAVAPPAGLKPSDGLQPPAFSLNSITVMDPDFRMPKTNMWSLSVQREVWNRTVLEVAYVGRRGVGLSGGYNVNQAEIFSNGFLDAFKVVKAGGESTLMNQLLASDPRLRTGETGSQMVRRLYASTLNLDSVAALASSIQSQSPVGGKSIPERSGFGSYFFVPFPQFSVGWSVIDSNDYSNYHGMSVTLERQYQEGLAFLLGYTLSKSLDTRSYDPVFTIVSTGSAQSASSTPFDIKNRRLNYAISDFDRTHVIVGRWSYELPVGKGRRWLREGALAKAFGGWEVAGFMTIQTGRPMTVYGGSYTMSNVVQTPANCNNCSRSFGTVFDDAATGYKWYFNEQERASFSTPAAGTLGNTGRNYFRGPGGFNTDLSVLKRTYVTESHYLEFRAEFLNLTNTPTFGFPTLTTTSSTFGRIRDTVSSYSRKMQLGLKYYF